MLSKIGHAIFRGKKLHFDEIGWGLVKMIAKKRKKSPKFIVIEALKRYAKTQNT